MCIRDRRNPVPVALVHTGVNMQGLLLLPGLQKKCKIRLCLLPSFRAAVRRYQYRFFLNGERKSAYRRADPFGSMPEHEKSTPRRVRLYPISRDVFASHTIPCVATFSSSYSSSQPSSSFPSVSSPSPLLLHDYGHA